MLWKLGSKLDINTFSMVSQEPSQNEIERIFLSHVPVVHGCNMRKWEGQHDVERRNENPVESQDFALDWLRMVANTNLLV